MADQVCGTCGTSNSGSASFCRVCDTFLGWHDDLDEPASGPATSESAEAGSDGSEPSTSAQEDATPTPPQDRVRPPAVSPDTADVVVTAAAPGSFELSIKNDSTIVDSYVIQPLAPPSWLTVMHSDTNLLPDQVRTVQVTLAIRPLVLALAQRTTIPLQVRSSVDPGQFTEVSVAVVVPMEGPPATLVAHPSLIRLEGRGQGTFALRFDNGAANHPRRYRMSASDPEGVVMFEFAPPTVDVAASDTADAIVRFAAPEPPPGRDVTRQLTITGEDEDGPVSVQVTVSQSTMPEPERQPVRMRVEPSQVAVVDSSTATVDLLIDNRAGTELVKVNLSGRDAAHAVSFEFEHRRVAIPAGKQGWVRVQLATAPPPRGQSVTRPFTIVAADGVTEVEAAGTIEVTSRQAAIATAQLRLVPEHLVVTSRRGTFAVDVDNRYGAEHLQVHLSGADEFGRARLRFSPADLTVPPGRQVRATLVVEHPRPPGGSSASRRVQVYATSGADTIQAEAVMTQQAQSYRRLWAILTTLVGLVLIVLGVIVYADNPGLDGAEADVRSLISDAMDGSMPAEAQIRSGVAVTALALVLLSAAVIALGMTSRTGRGVKGASIVAAVAGVAATVSSMVFGGLALVVAGAVVAFIGGILLRASSP
jgi:hypothetical protein